MEVLRLHRWDVTYREALEIQEDLKGRLVEQGPPGPPRTVAGADVSTARGDDTVFAAVVLFTFPDLELKEVSRAVGRASFPYIPGLLSFREGPVLLSAFLGLQDRPDCVIFDGQGIAHPRGIGLASHLGLLLDLPTVGCAKRRLVGTHDPVGEKAGDRAPLYHEGREVGVVLRTKDRTRPLFVSPGHRMDIEGAVGIVMACRRGYRLPEPVRQAHLEVNRMRLRVDASS